MDERQIEEVQENIYIYFVYMNIIYVYTYKIKVKQVVDSCGWLGVFLRWYFV